MSTINVTNIKHPSSSTNNIVLASDGSCSVTGVGATYNTSVSGSGQYQEFTSISSDVKKITFLYWNLSVSVGAGLFFQIGDSGGFETSGYVGTGYYDYTSGSGYANHSSGWHHPFGSPSHIIHGRCVIQKAESNLWVAHSVNTFSDLALESGLTGYKSLSGTLDRVRVGWNNGVYDGGKITLITEV